MVGDVSIIPPDPTELTTEQMSELFTAFRAGIVRAMSGHEEITESQEVVEHPDGLKTKTIKRTVTNRGPQKWACDLFSKMLLQPANEKKSTADGMIEFWEIADSQPKKKRKKR